MPFQMFREIQYRSKWLWVILVYVGTSDGISVNLKGLLLLDLNGAVEGKKSILAFVYPWLAGRPKCLLWKENQPFSLRPLFCLCTPKIEVERKGSFTIIAVRRRGKKWIGYFHLTLSCPTRRKKPSSRWPFWRTNKNPIWPTTANQRESAKNSPSIYKESEKEVDLMLALSWPGRSNFQFFLASYWIHWNMTEGGLDSSSSGNERYFIKLKSLCLHMFSSRNSPNLLRQSWKAGRSEESATGL